LLKKYYWFLLTISPFIFTSSLLAKDHIVCGQQKLPVVITKSLIQKLNLLESNSSNASEIEKLIGPPCSCLILNISPSNEAWTCQWKGDFSSNGISNMLNITFEAGQLASIVAIDKNGTSYQTSGKHSEIKTYKLR
jgi:hypothetical protein